jgi:hypothetical protein
MAFLLAHEAAPVTAYLCSALSYAAQKPDVDTNCVNQLIRGRKACFFSATEAIVANNVRVATSSPHIVCAAISPGFCDARVL